MTLDQHQILGDARRNLPTYSYQQHQHDRNKLGLFDYKKKNLQKSFAGVNQLHFEDQKGFKAYFCLVGKSFIIMQKWITN